MERFRNQPMQMLALKPWINAAHEGVVEPGQFFEATPLRAQELEAAGLAVPAVDETKPIKVVADPPQATPPPSPPQPRTAAPAKPPAKPAPAPARAARTAPAPTTRGKR